MLKLMRTQLAQTPLALLPEESSATPKRTKTDQNGPQIEDRPGEGEKNRNSQIPSLLGGSNQGRGKVARLPKPIRDQLNGMILALASYAATQNICEAWAAVAGENYWFDGKNYRPYAT